MWLTHNEPWCQAFLGYETGYFAPGHRDLSEALLCAHHLLLSHGLAVPALRARTKSPVGIAPNWLPAVPVSDTEADRAAAWRQDGYFNRWFAEPLAGRGYPEDMLSLYGERAPKVSAADLQAIAAPIDVLGINYYERVLVANDDEGGVLRLKIVRTSERPRTADREIYPEGLRELLLRLHQDYDFPRIVITENGAAYPDEVAADGSVPDAERVVFLRQHLEQVLAARRAGVPVDGYFAWSLLDNFEWAEGYSLRYGLVHVDFSTQARTPKQSAHFLRNLRKGDGSETGSGNLTLP